MSRKNILSLAESEKLYRMLFNSTSDGILLYSLTEKGTPNRFIEVNKTICKMTGYSREELLATNPTDLIEEGYSLKDNIIRGKKARGSFTFEVTHRNKNGSKTPVEISIRPFNLNGNRVELATVRDVNTRKKAEKALEDQLHFSEKLGNIPIIDITEQKRMKKQIEHRIALEEAIVQVSRMIVFSEEADLNKVLAIAGQSVEVHRAQIFRFHENSTMIDCINEWCSSGVSAMIDDFQDISIDTFSYLIDLIKEKEIFIVPDIFELPPEAATEKESMQRLGIRASLGVPIYSMNRKLVGVIGFDDMEKSRQWSDEDVKVLKVIAEMIGAYWARKKMEKKIQHRLVLEETIAEISRMIVLAGEADLNQVLKIVGEAVDVSRVELFRLRENGNKQDIVNEWCSPGLEPLITCLQNLDSNNAPYMMEKFRRGENVILSDLSELPTEAELEKRTLEAMGVQSVAEVPIFSMDGNLIGHIGFDDMKKKRQWSSEDIKLLQVVAEMIGGYWERTKAQEELEKSNKLLQQIIEFLPDATFVVDQDKKVISWNLAMEEMSGINKENIIGKGDYAYALPFYGIPRPVLIDAIFSDQLEGELPYTYIEKKGNNLRTEVFTPSIYQGKGAHLWATASPLYDNNDNMIGAIESIRDVTERKRMEDQLQYLATHDALTNIPNRYSLEENLKRAIAKTKRGEKSAILIIDLDNFKLVNDTLGHAAGDELLIALVDIFKTNLRAGDFYARIGGDEFAVLLEGISEGEAQIVAEKLRRAVCESELNLVTHKSSLNLSISVGIAMVDGALDYQRYLSLADAALYAAKEAGRNRVSFAKPDGDPIARLTETNETVGLIKNALQESRFILYFQPIVRIGDGKVFHYEALLRLKDKEEQLITPDRFIPVAERYGLMYQIDRWVVQKALATIQERPELHLFINLSGVTLGDEAILADIEADIRQSGIDPSRIGFEITETAVVKDLLRAERWVRRLKSLGCFFALDDFGIGFSSFSYLRMLPVDYIKIDGSFVKNVDRDPIHRALVLAINTIANTLGKKTIAEFVENEAILKVLQTIGVDCGQGYYLGRPAPLPSSEK